MEVWYAHQGVTTILLTQTPEGSTARAYDERGWPTFESSVSMLIKAGPGWGDWPALIDAALAHTSGCRRLAPLPPAVMRETLAARHFTNGADRDTVLALYQEVAETCIYRATTLDYYGLRWDDSQMPVLCEWLQGCRAIEMLEIGRNSFSAGAFAQLAVTLGAPGALPTLTELDCGHTGVARESLEPLAAILAAGALPALKTLELYGANEQLNVLSGLRAACDGRGVALSGDEDRSFCEWAVCGLCGLRNT